MASRALLNCSKVGPKDKEFVPIPIILRYVWIVCTGIIGNSRTDINDVAISLNGAGAQVVAVSVFAARISIVTGDKISIKIKKVKVCDHVDVDGRSVDGEVEATL